VSLDDILEGKLKILEDASHHVKPKTIYGFIQPKKHPFQFSEVSLIKFSTHVTLVKIAPPLKDLNLRLI